MQRKNGIFKGVKSYAKDLRRFVFPMTYMILEAYVNPEFPLRSIRDYEIVSTLRGGSFDPTRLRVRQFVEEYCRARGVSKFVAGEFNHASRTTIDTGYFGLMKRAQIIITANPSYWEGGRSSITIY